MATSVTERVTERMTGRTAVPDTATPGRRRAEKPARHLRYPLALCLGSLLAATAWVFLVRAAIDFGRDARAGEGAFGWVMTVAATVGATLCLVLVFAVLARMWAALGSRVAVRGRVARGSRVAPRSRPAAGSRTGYQPRRAAGARRAR